MRSTHVRRLVGIALMIALVFVMQALGGIIPPIGGFPITLVLIPVVLGSALYGFGAGALLGAAFGVLVYINCVTGADVGGSMVFHASPVLCFVVVMGKGILAGMVSGLVYKALSGVNIYLAMALAAAVCPLVNTGVFIVCMLLFFKDVLQAWAGGGELFAYILSGLVVVNFLPELAVNLLVSPASARVVKALDK